MKRFLVALLMTVVVVAGVTVGAALIFQNRYDELSTLQTGEDEALPSRLPELTAQNADPDLPGVVMATPVPTQRPTADSSAIRAKAIVSEMTLEEKLCQMFIVTPEGLTGYNKVTQSGDATRAAIDQTPVGGVVYFSANLVTVDQTTEMIANIQDFSRARTGLGLFIAVDEEGGSVARLADNLGTTEFDDMAVYGATGDAAKAYEIGSTIAGEMKSLGFNLDFAPVADVLDEEGKSSIGDRSFGSDPDIVASMVSQEVRGFVDGGVLCAPKHFPGHGSATGDTHNGSAISNSTPEELANRDLKPFRAAIAAGAPMIMVGHMTMAEIDPDDPACLSPSVVGGLRNEFDGVIITDALDMAAITGVHNSGEAAVLAVKAGCDMLLCPANLGNALEGLTEAVNEGRISRDRIDESVVRIVTAKLQYGLGA